jgi:hypothetical protein
MSRKKLSQVKFIIPDFSRRYLIFFNEEYMIERSYGGMANIIKPLKRRQDGHGRGI